jgi:hypothetical protein
VVPDALLPVRKENAARRIELWGPWDALSLEGFLVSAWQL